MPLPTQHTARQIAPSACEQIRRENDKFGPGISVNFCINGGRPVKVQSIHFDASKFTADEARAWLKKHGYSASEFEAATGKAQAGAVAAEMIDPDDCPYDKCPMRDAEGACAAGLVCSGPGTLELVAEAPPPEGGAAPAQAGPRRVNLFAYSGVPMHLAGWHSPVVVDLETLEVPRQSIPILRDHDPKRVAGHSDQIEVSPHRGVRIGGLLSGLPAHVDEIVHTGSRGYPWQVSIGAGRPREREYVKAGDQAVVNGRRWPGPFIIARGARLREASILSMGADDQTSAAVAEAIREIEAAGPGPGKGA